jgi:hypothetical protein
MLTPQLLFSQKKKKKGPPILFEKKKLTGAQRCFGRCQKRRDSAVCLSDNKNKHSKDKTAQQEDVT